MVRKWSTVPISLSYITPYYGVARDGFTGPRPAETLAPNQRPGFEARGGDIPQCLCVSGGKPVETRSSPSKPISRMAYCHAFGTHHEVKPCPSRAELTGGQPQSQPAHNQWLGWYPLHRQQERSVLSIHWRPEYTARFPVVRTHARTHAPTGTPWFTTGTHTFITTSGTSNVDESTPIAPRL